jgi:hypothetical protein
MDLGDRFRPQGVKMTKHYCWTFLSQQRVAIAGGRRGARGDPRGSQRQSGQRAVIGVETCRILAKEPMADRPFLPSSRTGRLFANPLVRAARLWLLLVTTFLIIWNITVGPGSGSGHSVAMPPSAQGDGPSSLWTTLAPLLMIGISFAIFLQVNRALGRSNAVGLKALADADYATAARTFQALEARYGWLPFYRAAISFNLGLARLYEGQLAESIACFSRADRSTAITATIKPLTAAHLALANALTGALPTAHAWLAEAERRAKKAPHPAQADAFVDFARGVLDVREGRADEFLRAFEERRSVLEGTLTVRSMRVLAALRAYATVRSDNEVGARSALEALKPIGKSEFALLGAEWPEMRTFLQSQQA